MQKLLLMSVLIATFAIPGWVRRTADGAEAFRRTTRCFLGFVGLYVFLLLYVYPRLS